MTGTLCHELMSVLKELGLVHKLSWTLFLVQPGVCKAKVVPRNYDQLRMHKLNLSQNLLLQVEIHTLE